MCHLGFGFAIHILEQNKNRIIAYLGDQTGTNTCTSVVEASTSLLRGFLSLLRHRADVNTSSTGYLAVKQILTFYQNYCITDIKVNA